MDLGGSWWIRAVFEYLNICEEEFFAVPGLMLQSSKKLDSGSSRDILSLMHFNVTVCMFLQNHVFTGSQGTVMIASSKFDVLRWIR